MPVNHKKMVMGVIVGNRGFFPGHLAKSGREEILRVLEAANMEAVALTPEESRYGAVETREESRRCAELFKRNRERIDGIIVTLPNFGEERAIADALRLADLRVPVLIQATPDEPEKMAIAFRRDSFCGKMSACNNLRQYGIPYSITTLHTESPDSPEFALDLEWFAAICRVVKGFRNLRVGAIGARPAAFNTVRYSEKILESQGISIETLDLSEVLGRIVEIVSGEPYDRFLRTRIFEPLGMKDTFFYPPDDRRSRLVTLYDKSGNEVTLSSDLSITLRSSDATEATADSSVTIYEGESSAKFYVAAVDNTDQTAATTVTFTASASGKAEATSGAMGTITTSPLKRLAYFPRTPPVMSYSGRMVSLNFADLVVFVGISFTPSWQPSADDA